MRMQGAGKMMGGVAFDGPVPPPLREGGPPNGGAALLQQKMTRQRQLALEKQRISARKQLGAGVIASASPMQSTPFRAKDWDQVLPDVLSLSPPLKDSRSEHKTAPSTPIEEVERPEPVKTGKLEGLDDALDGLAEELLLDERLPAPKRLDLASGGSLPSRAGDANRGKPLPGAPGAAGAGAWGDPKARQSVQSLAGIEEDNLYEASFELPHFRGEVGAGMRRKQQTLILEDGVEADGPPSNLTPNLARVARAPAASVASAAAPGKSWDLTIEVTDAKTEVRDRRPRAEGRSWWPFGGSSGAAEVRSETKEEVTAISSFSFD
ncbi:unnamed protein product [Durusdinium trenchii]|uniref:Uncharacterized protein n=1 Tax=Durusdinium trenchii TaxID=1381693 RepID=A0ABP0JFU4_9DINO